MTDPSVCESPEKHVYVTLSEAKRAAAEIRRDWRRPADRLVPYECGRPSHFHLSHEEPVGKRRSA